MTVTANNLDALKNAYRVWSTSRGEHYEHWLDLIADDFENGTLENGVPGLEFSKARRGKAAMLGYFKVLYRDWDMQCHVAEEFLIDRDRVVVLIRTAWKNRLTAGIVECPVAHIWRFKDGKAVSRFEFADSLGWAKAAGLVLTTA